MEKLSTDSDMISWVNLERDDFESHLFSSETIEATVEQYLNQFKSRVRQNAAELEANVEEYLRSLIQEKELELFPESKRLDLDKRHKARLEFVEKLARKIKLVALKQVGIGIIDDNVHQLISRSFSKLQVEDMELAPKEQIEQWESMEIMALSDELEKCFLFKEELDAKRFEEFE